ncbi:RagB/SusD family nutrient uptake outer membrane protein [Winogradskyella sp.]|uniref:RagB/SusD family nutrient uptake outer membrane protein n=1 Tax=Winogradskyella sp. TaxID=1883156 RepID=UPI00260B53D4|nr:RagB/SusD family nutrient uptake outer membrane protein [Winogradskyella sp.]
MKKSLILFKKIKSLRLRLFTILCLTIVAASCSNDFLEEPENNSGITEDVVFNSRENVQLFVSGILSNYKGQYSDANSPAAADAGGLYSLYMARAVKGKDLIQGGFPYNFDYEHGNREPNFRRVIFAWGFNYLNVNYANILIDGVQSSALNESDKKEFIAIGKFFRAYHHFQLLLDFCPNYNNDRLLARIPYYTTRVTLETANGNPPSPMSEIYDFVIQDLEEAIVDLPDTRLGKSYVNKKVAQAILARVLSVTQDDWSRLSELSKTVYDNNASQAVQSANWGNGFNDMQDDEWIWAMFQNGNDETNFFWGHPAATFDHTVLSWQVTYADSNFANLFSPTDVRNTFFDFYGAGASEPWRDFVSSKFAFSFASDIPILRKSEFVLLDAEAQYHLGNTQEAQSLLFALQSDRDPNAVMSNNSGTALLNEILLERRKEFYGEFGVEWFDAKRYNLAIERDVNTHRVDVDVPVNSNLFFLKLPEVELDANPFYTDGFIND